MSEIQDSLYPDDWKKAARKDWHRIAVLLEDNDADGAAFFLQQSIEKYLKAFLLERGWKLKKTHELDTLLDYAVGFDSGLEKFRELCERVAGYYFTERYPMLVPSDLTVEDIEADKAVAEEMIKALIEKVPEG
jgi:HEPN domain-containing protein